MLARFTDEVLSIGQSGHSIDKTEKTISEFLAGLPPETDATLVAIILVREGLNYFVQSRGRDVAENTAAAVLEHLCEQRRATR